LGTARVAHAAASAFLIAGLVLLAGAANALRLQNWLAAAVAAVLVVLAAWVALGSDGRCSATLPIPFLPPDSLCRAGFGAGALVGLVILAACVRHAVPESRQPDRDV
jgi:uncharacterized membrane protein YedE/YeeE